MTIWTATYNVSFWIIIMVLFTYLFLFAVCIWSLFFVVRKISSDKVIFYDKNDRWELIDMKIRGKEVIDHNGKSYNVPEDSGNLSRKGKVLLQYTINNPSALKIRHNKTEWLTSENLDGVINNRLIQQLIKPTDKFMDMLFLLGSIGGILAGIASFIVLLITIGVIKPPG